MADVRNLSSEELEAQKNLLKEQDLIQQRIEERNKRMAVAGQEEIKRLKKRNEQDEENLKTLEDKLEAFDDIEDKAKDYVKFWEQAGERQEEYLDMVEGFQTSFTKLGNDVKKVLTSSTKNSSAFAGITAKILELKKAEVNASDDERKNLQARRTVLEQIRQSQIDSAESLVSESQDLFGMSEAARRRMEFETSIVGLSEEDRKIAEQVFAVNEKLTKQQERIVELKQQMSGIVASLPEGIQSIVTGIGDLAKGIINGLGPIVILGGLLAAAIHEFSQMQSAAKKFREETGLTKNQTEELNHQVHSIYKNYAKLGVTADDYYETVKALKTEFGDTVKFSEAVAASMIVLNKNFAVAEKDAAAVNMAFQSIGGLSAETSQNLAQQVAYLSDQVGVAPAKVFEDISEASEDTYKYFRGDVTLLARQAIQARRLGTNLKSVLKTTEGLLNFEEGIEKELLASSMLAGQFNLSKARALAFDGKAADAQAEILRQVQRYRKFADMDPITKQAVADATNMTVEELGKQLLMQEKLTHMSDSQKKLVETAMDKGLDITNMNEQQLAAKVKELETQEQIADKITQLENSFKGIVAALSSGFVPLIEAVTPLVTTLANMFGAVFGALNKIPGLFPAIIGGLTAMYLLSKKTAIMKTKEAIASIFAGNAKWGAIGVIAAGVAIGGLMGYLGRAEKVGDMAMQAQSSGGSTTIATSEGGIFETSRNDQIAVGPDILGQLDAANKSSVGPIAAVGGGTSMNGAIKVLVNEMKQLRQDMNSGKIRTTAYLDGNRVSSGIATSVDESSRNVFSYGQRG
jgi:hypothetical protein